MIDSSKLPPRALIDTGIVTRAIGGMPQDADTPISRSFYEAMLTARHDLLIAAPTVAEIMRADGRRNIPRVAGIEVVAFDDEAAIILGRTFPMSVLRAHIHEGTTLNFLKYDAMIVACAVRHRARCIVALDGDIHRLGSAINIPVYHPRHFLATAPSISSSTPDAVQLFNNLVPNALAQFPEKAREVNAIYCFIIRGAGSWTLDCTSSPPTCTQGDSGKAQCTIEVSSKDFEAMLTDPAAGMRLYYSGRLRVSGDPALAVKLQTVFELARHP